MAGLAVEVEIAHNVLVRTPKEVSVLITIRSFVICADLRALLSASILVFCALGCGPPPKPVEAIQASATTADAAPIAISETDWPWWRGPQQSGVVPGQNIPAEWNADDVTWSQELAGLGHSSPIVIGQQVIITTADEGANTQSILSFDRATGTSNWQVPYEGRFVRMHHKNSHASATAATDGKHVFVPLVHDDALFVHAVTLDGKKSWSTEVGPFQSEHGYGSSPVIYQSLVIVNGDSRGQGYEAAIHRETGEIVWRTPRNTGKGHGSYASPIVANLAGRDQLIQPGLKRVTSYDPQTGEELWFVDGPAEVQSNSIAYQDPYVIATGGYPEKEVFCIKADGSGNVTDSHIQWRVGRNAPYVPSPMIYGKQVLCLTDNGVLASYALADGKRQWQERLSGNFSSSITQVGELFLTSSEEGETLTFRVGDSGIDNLVRNSIGRDEFLATPVVSRGQIFLRSKTHLYCIGTDGSAQEAAESSLSAASSES